MDCRCEEAKLIGFVRRTVKGKVTPLEPAPGWQQVHDCGYVRDRNSLIPEAERLANLSVAHLPDGMAKEQEWSRAFLGWMDDLSRALRAS